MPLVLPSGLEKKFSVQAASSASKGSPFWKTTPSRSVISSVVGSSHSHAVASIGICSPVSGSRQTSVSNIIFEAMRLMRLVDW